MTDAPVRSISARQTRALRHRLLRPGQPYEETAYAGDTDVATLHAGAFLDGVLVGVASVLRQDPSDGENAGAWRLRGMATVPDVRGRGLGAALLSACIGHAAREGGRRLWCHARAPAVGFYTRDGFAVRGAEYDVPPIGPHRFLERPLAAADAGRALTVDGSALHVTTERLVLRPWRASDLEAFAGLHADAEVMAQLHPGRPLSGTEASARLEGVLVHWRRHGFGRWALEDRTSGAVAGWVGLAHLPGWADPDLAWLLARERWGRGLAAEAARAALAYGFGVRRMDRVTSIIRPANAASQRLADRLGLRPAGETAWRGAPARVYVLERGRWEASARTRA